jgi:DNA-binding GntR family transcriptional regulator
MAGGATEVKPGGDTLELLSAKIYQQLRQDIITGALKPEVALTEAALCHRYGASRTPVREACARLQRERWLRAIPYKGYLVAPVTLKDVQEIYHLRLILESEAAEAAANHIDPNDLQRIGELVKIKYTPGDAASHAQFIQADTEIHLLIAKATHNERLYQIVKELLFERERLLYLILYRGEHGPLVSSEHKELYQAIKLKRPKEARKLMADHVTAARQRMLNNMFRMG